MSGRARGWCMTLNNYVENEYEMLCDWMSKNCEYGCIGREVGTNGTPHLQMCCEFKNMKSFKQMTDVCKRWHVEKRKGTKSEAAEYCKKDGKYTEFGTLGNEQGKRSDINEVRNMVKEGKTMRDIVEVTSSYQAIKYAETLRKYMMKPRCWKPEVFWYWGPTGTGKSRLAFDQSNPDDRWVSMNGLKWWDGYDGQSDVIIEDFRGCDCTLKTLLRILDRYEYRIENKGGSTQLLAKRIWITCPYSPDTVYNKTLEDEDMKQLIRRIDKIIQFDADTYNDMTMGWIEDIPKCGWVDCDDEDSGEWWDNDDEL